MTGGKITNKLKDKRFLKYRKIDFQESLYNQEFWTDEFFGFWI